MRPHRKVQNESTKNDPVIEALPAACADETLAVEFMEKQRWGEHPACPFCGSEAVYQMMDSKDPTKRQANFRWRCREKECHQQFTVRIGTVFEDSRRMGDRKSTRLNSSHVEISYAVFCL